MEKTKAVVVFKLDEIDISVEVPFIELNKASEDERIIMMTDTAIDKVRGELGLDLLSKYPSIRDSVMIIS